MHLQNRDSGPAQPASAENRTDGYRWWALSCTSLGTLMATLNSGTLIIALPDLMKSLHTQLFTLVWVLLSYMIMQTVLVVMAGRIADIVGRKRLYVIGFAIFGVSALLSGFASNGTQLVLTRAVQGAAAAFMMANSAAIVADAFPKRQLGLALGTNMIVAAVGLILGTILGGWLTEIGWQWVFWFNVPVAVIGTIWAAWKLREISVLDKSKGHDVTGASLYFVSIVGLLLALTAGGIYGWTSTVVVGGLIVAVIGIPIFLRMERRSHHPMLDLKLFAHRSFALGSLSVFFNSMARMGITFLFVFYFQGPKGLDPITTGILLTPIAASMLIVSPISGVLADRQGSQRLSSIGLALNVIGLAGMSFISIGSTYWYIAATMVVLGLGSGFFNSPNTRLIMTSVAPNQRGVAAGVRSMLMNSGGVVSIALVLAIVTSSVDPKDLFAIFAGVASGLSPAALAEFTGGFHLAFWVLTALSLVAFIVSLVPLREGTGPDASTATDDEVTSVSFGDEERSQEAPATS